MDYVYFGHELYHHGIKGQRWGERNGPPYPLSASKHNSVVGKSEASGQLGMDADVANALIQTATAATMLVSYVAYKKWNQSRIRKKIAKEDLKKDEGKLFSDLNDLEKTKTLADTSYKNAVKANPSFNINDVSTTSNCPNCTMATELRLRGYDVEARHLTGGKSNVNIFNDAFQQKVNWEAVKPGTDMLDSGNGLTYVKKSNESNEAYKQRRYSELTNTIATKSGNDSHGSISFISPVYGMGHVFNYSVDSAGKVTFLDGQDGTVNADSNINDLDDTFKFSFARLDNLTISNGITDYVRKH